MSVVVGKVMTVGRDKGSTLIIIHMKMNFHVSVLEYHQVHEVNQDHVA